MPPSPPQAPSTGVLFPPFPSCAAAAPPPTAAALAAASPPLAAAILPAAAAALSSPLLSMPPAPHTAAVAPYTCAAAVASPPSHTATPPADVSSTTAAVWKRASAVSYSTTTSRECAAASAWPAKSLTAAVAYPCAATAPPGHSAAANDVAASAPSSAPAAISSSAAAASSINSTAAPFSVSPCIALSYPRRTLHTFLSTQTRKASVSSSPERQQEQGKQERPLCTTEQQQQKYVQQQQQQAYMQQQQEQKEGRSGYTQDELLSSFTRQLNLRPASSLLHLRRCAGVAAAPTAHAPAAAAAASPWSAATSWNSSLLASAASSFAAPPSPSAARPPPGAAATPVLSPPAAAATSFFSTDGAPRTAPAAAAAAAAASAPSSSSGTLCTPAPAGGKALCGAASVPRRVSAAAAASLPAYAGCGSLYCSPTPAGQAATRSREAKRFAPAAAAACFFGKGGVACDEQGDGRRAGAVTPTDSVGDSEDAASSLASTGFLTSPASSVPASDSESPRSGVSVLAAATVGAAAATAAARRPVVETPAETFIGAAGRAADSTAEGKTPPLLLHAYSSPTGAPAAAGEAPTTHASLLLVSSPAAAAGAAAFLSKEGAGGTLRNTATAATIRRVAEGTPRSRTSATTAAACCPAGTAAAAVRSSSAAAAATPPQARGGRIHSLGAARLQRTAAAHQTAAATGEVGAAEGEAGAPEEAATRSASCINGERVTPEDVRVRAAATQPAERSRAAEAAAGRGGGAGLRRREETATAYAPQGAELTAAAAAPEEEAAVQVTPIRWSPFQQRRSLSTTACSSVNSSSDRNSAKSGACAAAAADLANAACDTDTAADTEPPFAAAAATVLGVAAGSSTRRREDFPNTYETAAVYPQDLNCMRQQLQLSKLQQQTQVQQQQQRPTLQQQQHPLQQKQQVPTQQQQQEDLLQQQEATQQGQQEQRLLLLQQSTQEQQTQIQEQQQTLQRRQTHVNQVAKFFGWTESQGNLAGTTLRASSYSSTGSSCHSNASSSSGRDGTKGKARAVRACPKSLSTRHILTKPRVGKAPAVSCSKYRCSAGQGIQVPSVRVETTPLKLNNWSVSWQEVLCYNPRPYDITEEFKENYVAMRSEMERAITSIVDIVFVDRNFSHLYPPYIYHAYLIPPIRPHSPLSAASIQCHTSDDLWLRKGAWRRVRRRDAGGKIVEVLLPVNPEVTPFAPGVTAEQQRQQRLQHVSQSNHPLYNQRHLSHQQHFRREAKLPLHLWLLLGGKDMQGLDGLVLAWKFLRFASEIPPSEFVEANESTTGGPRCGFKVKKDGAGELYGSLDWRGRLSGAELYKQYHQQGRNPAHDQLAGKDVSSSTGFSPFGPFLFDMKGVAETAQYRIAFLMVDIPGYGNSSGHPSPDTIRSCVLQSVKHALLELVEQHEEEAIVINVLGYSLGCAVAVALCADLAESIRNDLAAGLEVGSPAASSFSCGCCRDDVRFSVAATCVPARRSEGSSPGLCCCSCHSKIDTASQALEEQLKGIRLEQHADRSKPTLHAGVNFDAASNLTFKDTCNITMYEDGAGTPYVSRLKEDHVRHPAAVHELRGLRIAVNRLVLVAPFTSVQAMASRVAAATLGGGGLISRAAGALVSRQINWDNEASLRRLFSSMHDIEEQSQADVFRNFRLYIQHGECDTVIPWTMGYEVYRIAQSLKTSFNLHHIPLQFVKMTGETHASILCGKGELTLLESCFCPYRLHPAAPLALLKFYSRQFLLPRLPGTFSVGPPLGFSQASTLRMRPCVPTEKSSNATNTKFTPSSGLSHTRCTQKFHSTGRVITNKPPTKTSYSAYSAADATAARPVVEMLLCGGSCSSFGSSTCRDVHGGESSNGARVSCGETPPQAASRRNQRASSLHRSGSYVAASTAQSELARFLTSALTRKAAVSDKPFSSATCATILPLATGVPMRG